ncbi:MAG: hypothetical protein ACLRFE_04010 [Clostridia bacterium]
MEKTKAQEKFLKILELINGCREKLFATYNLFVANLEQTKQIKAELGEKYEQLLDLRSEYVQLTTSNKPAKMRIAKVRKDAKALKVEHDNQVVSVDAIMDDAKACRKTYKQEVAMCCDTYKQLKTKLGTDASIDNGYKQQVKLVKRILDKIDTVKVGYKAVRDEIKEQAKMFLELFNKINEDELALN